MAAQVANDAGVQSAGVDDPSKVTWLMFQSELETRVPVDTSVVGEIPKWLSGTLYRNGCGLFDKETTDTTHLFEGYGVLHRYDIKDGDVKYTSRILDREAWLRAVKANRLAVAEDGTTKEYPDPCVTAFAGTASYFKKDDGSVPAPNEDDDEDKTGVNIVEHGDKVFALTESAVMQEVDPVTLARKSKVDLQKLLSVHMATAHPHFERGALYNLGTSFAPPNNYNIIMMPAHSLDSEKEIMKRVKLVASVQSRFNFSIGYSHSFGMSEKHFIILEQPATLSTMKILKEGKSKVTPSNVFKNFDLHPDEKIRFYLISRRHGNQVISTQYLAPSCFTFHFVNCYDDGDYVVVDLCSYDNLSIINDLSVTNVTTSREDVVTSTIRRYVLPTDISKSPIGHNLPTLPYTTARAKVVSPGVVHLTPDYICKKKDKIYIELPRFNYELCAGRKYRYVYGTSLFTKVHRLIKLDLVTRTPVYWEQEGYDPGEPVFVPRPGATEEDDGVLLSPVISLTGKTPCFLVILDARTFTEIARATTPSGVRIAMSFHGNFYTKPN